LVALLALPAGATAQKTIEVRRLELKIQETLVAQLGEDARTIQVALNGQKAFLSGTVEERVTQELAKEVVLSFDEVASATNRIEARKTPTILEGQAFLEGQDVEIEFRVNRAMTAALGKLAKAINVEVVDGVASLRGPVPDAAMHELAISTAKGIAGVERILDLLRPQS
jgi:osmotically-inducible protein OsmY